MAFMQKREPTCEEIKEERLYREMGLLDSEYEKIAATLGRLPNYTETGLFSVMWSEHCSYKHSRPILKKFPTSGQHVLQGPGEGAGVVDIGDGLAVVFKIESHNHPSAIEPYQGAATGVGGIIRDVFSMGARPIALLNSLRFGELSSDKVRYLLERVVAGIADYGNCVGIPTVGGEVYFDASYDGNPLVNAMCVGVAPKERLQRGVAEGVGNTVMVIGARTGRDGIHGATFASEELDDASEDRRPQVQVGDPFMEKLLLEATLELVQHDWVIGVQDMGAAGLTSSASEMAAKAKTGIELHLDHVPVRESGMTPYEMMLSESQERMLVIVKRGREEEAKAICAKWGLHAVAVGRVTAEKRLRVLHRGTIAADVPVKLLVDEAPVYRVPSSPPKERQRSEKVPVVPDLKEALLSLLARPTIASKAWVYEQYDSMVRTNTVVGPGSDAAVIRLRGTNKALALSTDGNARYLRLDPETGGKIAVAEAARNIVAAGARPLAITNCLNFGNPENPVVYWQMEKAVTGMSAACRSFATPVVSGNVSLYNETNGKAIDPTPIVGIVGLVEDLKHITPSAFLQPGDEIYVLGEAKAEFGGSELQQWLAGEACGPPPAIDLSLEAKRQKQLLQAIQSGLVASCHDVSEGGLAVAVAEAMIPNQLGAEIVVSGDPIVALFSETQSRFLISVKPQHKKAFIEATGASYLGKVTGRRQLEIKDDHGRELLTAACDELAWAWKEAIPCSMKKRN